MLPRAYQQVQWDPGETDVKDSRDPAVTVMPRNHMWVLNACLREEGSG